MLGRAKGQSLVEGLIALPIFLLFCAALVQLVWLLLAQHLLNSATRYVALQESVKPGSSLEQQAVFLSRMKPLPGRGYVVPLISVLEPELALVQNADLTETDAGQYLHDMDYVHIQLQERTDQQAEAWLKLAVVNVEVKWCFPLRVPWVSEVVNVVDWFADQAHQAYCAGYGQMGTPHFPLRSVSKVPLKATREWQPQL